MSYNTLISEMTQTVVDNSEYKHRFVNYKLFLFKDVVGNTVHCATRAINGHFLDVKKSKLLSFPQKYISIDLVPLLLF